MAALAKARLHGPLGCASHRFHREEKSRRGTENGSLHVLFLARRSDLHRAASRRSLNSYTEEPDRLGGAFCKGLHGICSPRKLSHGQSSSGKFPVLVSQSRNAWVADSNRT